MPRNTASYSPSRFAKATSEPTSHPRRNSTPMSAMISWRFSSTSFSSLKGGIPKVRSPPMRSCRSNTTGRTPHVRHVGPPAGLERLVGDVLLDGADADCAEAVIERAGALAQAILRADAAAHLGERVGLVRQLRRLEQIPLLDQLQPVGDVVVNRAFPLAEGIATGKTAPRLLRRAARIVGAVDLAESGHP